LERRVTLVMLEMILGDQLDLQDVMDFLAFQDGMVKMDARDHQGWLEKRDQKVMKGNQANLVQKAK
jgi:hypothetical protein